MEEKIRIIDELEQMVGGRFQLTALLQKRIRELVAGAPRLVDIRSDNPVDIAIEEVRAGKSLEAAAEESGYSVEKEREIGREEEGVPAEVRQKIFSMSPPGENAVAWDSVELATGSYAVIGLHAISDADPSTVGEDERDSVRRAIAESRGRVTFDSYVQKLRDEIGVTIIRN